MTLTAPASPRSASPAASPTIASRSTSSTGRAGDGTVQRAGSVGLSAAAGLSDRYPRDARQCPACPVAMPSARPRPARSPSPTDAANGATITGDLRLPERPLSGDPPGRGRSRRADRRPPQGRAAASSRSPGNRPPCPACSSSTSASAPTTRSSSPAWDWNREWGANLRVTGTSAAPSLVGRAIPPPRHLQFRRPQLRSRSDQHDPVRGRHQPGTGDHGDQHDRGCDDHAQHHRPRPEPANRAHLDAGAAAGRTPVAACCSAARSPASRRRRSIQLAAALNSLAGSGGGLNPLGKLRSATGLSRLRILGADQTTGRGTAVAAGQYIPTTSTWR